MWGGGRFLWRRSVCSFIYSFKNEKKKGKNKEEKICIIGINCMVPLHSYMCVIFQNLERILRQAVLDLTGDGRRKCGSSLTWGWAESGWAGLGWAAGHAHYRSRPQKAPCAPGLLGLCRGWWGGLSFPRRPPGGFLFRGLSPRHGQCRRLCLSFGREPWCFRCSPGSCMLKATVTDTFTLPSGSYIKLQSHENATKHKCNACAQHWPFEDSDFTQNWINDQAKFVA